jgi:hypothetical protein
MTSLHGSLEFVRQTTCGKATRQWREHGSAAAIELAVAVYMTQEMRMYASKVCLTKLNTRELNKAVGYSQSYKLVNMR